MEHGTARPTNARDTESQPWSNSSPSGVELCKNKKAETRKLSMLAFNKSQTVVNKDTRKLQNDLD